MNMKCDHDGGAGGQEEGSDIRLRDGQKVINSWGFRSFLISTLKILASCMVEVAKVQGKHKFLNAQRSEVRGQRSEKNMLLSV
ncbi:hypothetical protein VNO78_23478 [Psophocarpus tetragonolobus]|uniref:Uncharacterized protein n=1 Tax=Psophocarpus tetragonolobus TaxID=3891 RepID=A0AAN9S435_PSOTE